MAHPP
jgi:hypothetical protein